MNKKIKMISDWFMVLFFVGILITASLTTIFKEKEKISFFENRSLATMPKMTTETLVSGEWGNAVESYLVDHAAGRITLLKADTYINTYILKQPLVNEVVVTEEYLLPEIADWMESTDTIESDTEIITKNLSEISSLVSSYGGTYYYVGVPCQYVFYEDEYPWYMNNRSDYTEQSVASLSKALDKADVNFIDIGKICEEYNWPDELSSAVDNHYNIYGAYVAYHEIMKRINEDTGLGLTVLEEGDYVIEELPNHYMGSRTRKMMDLWPCDEKLNILNPNISVPFTRSDNGVETAATVYSMPKDQWENVLYSLYMGGDIAFTEIDTNREELPSVLIYGDSFTNAVECIMYYGFDKMYSLDMRHYTEKNLGEFIEMYQPDIVMCIRDYEALLSDESNGCGLD